MINKEIDFSDLGLIEYKKAWDRQKELFSEIVRQKSNNKDKPEPERVKIPNYLIFCEHPHVYTLGKSGSVSNLLINEIQLKQKGAELYNIDRGGDITYHGPGQIVAYPILDLENFGLGIRKYIHLLEESVILTLKEYDISSGRLKNAAGVWLDAGDPERSRKICAIGVKSSRWITMHGFAFNVNTGLDFYNYINPCGLLDKGVTSMEKELGGKQDMEKVKKILLKHFITIFS
jgi:lipoyl(octanoyl) transferase